MLRSDNRGYAVFSKRDIVRTSGICAGIALTLTLLLLCSHSVSHSILALETTGYKAVLMDEYGDSQQGADPCMPQPLVGTVSVRLPVIESYYVVSDWFQPVLSPLPRAPPFIRDHDRILNLSAIC